MKVFLKEAVSGNLLTAFIERASAADITYVKRHKKQFAAGFDWDVPLEESSRFSIRLESGELSGMMALDIPEGFHAVQIKLIEVVKENTRATKKIEWIAGCLLAYACRYSVDKGFYGDVFLRPKGYLIKAYEKYGFYPFGKTFLLCTGEQSLKLMEQYLGAGIK
jgi:hypothetical protein